MQDMTLLDRASHIGRGDELFRALLALIQAVSTTVTEYSPSEKQETFSVACQTLARHVAPSLVSLVEPSLYVPVDPVSRESTDLPADFDVYLSVARDGTTELARLSRQDGDDQMIILSEREVLRYSVRRRLEIWKQFLSELEVIFGLNFGLRT